MNKILCREENDIDKAISEPLWKKVPAFEKQIIEAQLIRAEAKKEDTTELKAR